MGVAMALQVMAIALQDMARALKYVAKLSSLRTMP
jgi:hypothetical protein